jgi:hypothetical protein
MAPSKWFTALVFSLTAFCLPAPANDTSKELAHQLKSRYEHQKLKVVVPNVVVGLFSNEGRVDTNFNVHYDHFYPTLEIPKKWNKRDNLDDRTSAEVNGSAEVIDRLSPGETLEAIRIELFKYHGYNFYAFDLMLRSLSTTRLATRTEHTGSGTEYKEKAPFGVHFRFAFPIDLIESGSAYDAVIKEIDPYLLPASEYKEAAKQAAVAAESAKKIDIQPGMSKEEVVKSLGEPLKTITFGSKTILKYKDMTIELQDGKVTDVKAD